MTIEGLASLLKKSRDNQLEEATRRTPLKTLERVVFIDSTWPQSYSIRTVRVHLYNKSTAFYHFPIKT